ncbi:zinc-ribbon domain-containing protein [Paracoccus sp. SCSIO 75233]|uniref:zinc-ribbon domain-containing protein n=1 Tax=Paracoccus sp. SCSIO 75233 TaxID=3017782 RepID=UPI0022F0B239|nr:zinc-ribbon domain-containing protein [Paracoccus sp. SCSIO 75233]WBU53416.1 zinc-ribbon domain-containing protein [Paracoccus sp. SCSIO 75233]
MRLICPRCNTRYDLPGEMIPPEGREVECSACGNIWMQTQAPVSTVEGTTMAQPTGPVSAEVAHLAVENRGVASDLRNAAKARSTEGEAIRGDALTAADLGEPPKLQRPLPDDVLAILREETARELSARRAHRDETAPITSDLPPVETLSDEPEIAADGAELAASQSSQSAGAAAGPPVDDVDPPAVQPPPESAAEPDPSPEALPGPETPSPDDVEWPATTVIDPDDSAPRIVATQEKPRPKPDFVPIPATAPRRVLSDDVLSDAEKAGETLPPVNSPQAPATRRTLPDRQRRPLPDAEKLAATIQTEQPASDVAGVSGQVATPAVGRGYDAGFARAIMVLVLLVIAYVAAAIWSDSGQAPAQVAMVVDRIDALRADLYDAAIAVIDPIAGRE